MHHQTMNIQNNFGLSFKSFICASHLQCPNENCEYMHYNAGLHNKTKWVGLTHAPLYVGVISFINPNWSIILLEIWHTEGATSVGPANTHPLDVLLSSISKEGS